MSRSTGKGSTSDDDSTSTLSTSTSTSPVSQLGVDGVRGPGHNLARHRDDALQPQVGQGLEGRLPGMAHQLDDPGPVVALQEPAARWTARAPLDRSRWTAPAVPSAGAGRSASGLPGRAGRRRAGPRGRAWPPPTRPAGPGSRCPPGAGSRSGRRGSGWRPRVWGRASRACRDEVTPLGASALVPVP